MPSRVWATTIVVVALVLAALVRVSDTGHADLEPVRISAGAVTIVEADTGTRVVHIPVTLSAPSHAALRVHYVVGPYQPLGGTAALASDLDTASGTLRFDVSPTTGLTAHQASVAVRVHSDTAAEPIKSYAVTLSDLVVDGAPGSAVISTPVAVGTIFDDDPSAATRVSVGSVTIPEGGPGITHTAEVPVTLSAPAPTAVAVQYEVKGVTAVHGADFGGPDSGTVTFPPGVVERTIDVPILGDGRSESDETLAVGLRRATGASIGTALGVVLVRDPTYFGVTPGPHVAVTGDSITDVSEGALRKALASTYSSSILAVPGATMAVMTPYLRDQLRSAPDATVINLGTNDAMLGNRNWARDLATIRATVAGVPCIEFVTVNDTIADRLGSFFVGHPVSFGAQINAALHEAAATNPKVHLVDWKAAVDANAAPDGTNVLTVDGIHPSGIGQEWLASHIHDAVDRDCR